MSQNAWALCVILALIVGCRESPSGTPASSAAQATQIDVLKQRLKRDPANRDALIELVRAYEARGESDHAKEIFDRFFEKNPQEMAALRLDQCEQLLLNGRLEQGLGDAQRLCRDIEQHYGTSHRLTGRAYEILGLAELSLGDTGAAEGHLARSLSIFEPGPVDAEFSLDGARVADRWINLLRITGRTLEAQLVAQAVLESRRRLLPPDHEDIAASVLQLAEVLVWKGRHAEAAPHIQQARTFYEQRFERPHPTRALAALLSGLVQSGLGRYEVAQAHLSRAAEDFAALQMWNRAAEAEVLLAQHEIKLGDPKSGELRIRRILPDLEQRIRPDHPQLSGVYAYLGQALRLQGDLAAAEEELQGALRRLTAAVKQQSQPLRALQYSRMLYGKQILIELSLVQILRGRNNAALDTVETLRRLALSDEPLNTRDTAKSLQSTLRPGEAFASIQQSNDSVTMLLMVYGDYEVRSFVLAPESDDAKVCLEDARMAAAELRQPRRVRPALERLRKRLCPPTVADGLRRSRRLIIASDVPLADVPLDLVFPVEQVTYVPAASTLCGIRERRAPPTTHAAPSLLLVSNPEYNNWRRWLATEELASQLPVEQRILLEEELPLKKLPGAVDECRAIAGIAERIGADVLTLYGADATLRAVEENLSGRTIVHFATHAFEGFGDHPGLSRLYLSPEDPTRGLPPQMLTLDYMLAEWDQRFQECELVVLAACKTDRGVQVGPSAVSLSWGFIRAGCSTVIASRWRVEDQATRLLMGRFYTNLLLPARQESKSAEQSATEGMSPADALAEARAWLRAQPRSQRPRPVVRGDIAEPLENATDYADAYFWAGFVLVGEPDVREGSFEFGTRAVRRSTTLATRFHSALAMFAFG